MRAMQCIEPAAQAHCRAGHQRECDAAAEAGEHAQRARDDVAREARGTELPQRDSERRGRRHEVLGQYADAHQQLDQCQQRERQQQAGDVPARHALQQASGADGRMRVGRIGTRRRESERIG
jgi:hypothetical protein